MDIERPFATKRPLVASHPSDAGRCDSSSSINEEALRRSATP
jgi:hypothetical protein